MSLGCGVYIRKGKGGRLRIPMSLLLSKEEMKLVGKPTSTAKFNRRADTLRDALIAAMCAEKQVDQEQLAALPTDTEFLSEEVRRLFEARMSSFCGST